MSDLSDVKPGDKLFIKSGHYDRGHIEDVERITPTGRVIVKRGTFERSGRLRGGNSWCSTYARPATEDDIAGNYRYGLVSKISNFRGW